MNNSKAMEELEERIGYVFRNKKLLKQALTHSSFANEQKINKWEDYERIEFLGDAVLELVSSDYLYRMNARLSEGELTKLRSSMVCEPALAYCARDIELGQFIFLGKGEESTGGRKRDSITSDVMEAVIGAIYLDGGLDCARAFIDRFVLSDLEDKQLFYDSKTILQERVQKDGEGRLHYVLVEESGPEHDKLFRVEAMIDDRKVGEGSGRTKKHAEQQAAYQVLVSRYRKEQSR